MVCKILDFIYSVFFNFKYLPLKLSFKLPIKISHKVKIFNLKKENIEIISNNIEMFMIKLGFDGSSFISENKSSINIINNGKIFFYTGIVIGEGFNLFIDNGNFIVGRNVYINRNFLVQCINEIKICDNCLIGWNTCFRDTSGHKIIKNGVENNYLNKIYIGKKVWVASNVTIVGNNLIKDGCIIACNSVVINFKSNLNNKLLAGCPAKEKEGDYTWIE